MSFVFSVLITATLVSYIAWVWWQDYLIDREYIEMQRRKAMARALHPSKRKNDYEG